MQLLLAMPMILCWYCKEFLFLVMWVLQWELFCTGRTKNKFLLVIPTLSEHQHTLSPAEYQYTSTQTNIFVSCKTLLSVIPFTHRIIQLHITISTRFAIALLHVLKSYWLPSLLQRYWLGHPASASPHFRGKYELMMPGRC